MDQREEVSRSGRSDEGDAQLMKAFASKVKAAMLRDIMMKMRTFKRALVRMLTAYSGEAIGAWVFGFVHGQRDVGSVEKVDRQAGG